MKILVFVSAFLLLVLVPQKSESAVWTSVNEWSPTWEDRYSDWVRDNWQVDFFSRKLLPHGQSNPYYGLRVDCADTVYSMRAVFAFENKLPFVIQDPSASGRTISNVMARWDSQNEQQRIRNFLSYLYDVISTRSLPNDTYPVAISRDVIRSGALIMTTKTNHHSWTLKEMLPIGVPYLVYNSVVGSYSGFGLQQRQSWPHAEWVFEGDFTAAGNAGFRTWRPQAYLGRPVWEVPGYSEEQYKIPLSKWEKTLQSRLALKQETDTQQMTRLVNTACDAYRNRVPSVNEALQYIAKNPGCMDYPTYDTYSTPNRDQRLFDDLMSLRRSYRDIQAENGGRQLAPEMVAQLNKIFPAIGSSARSEAAKMTAQEISATSVCIVDYRAGKKMDLAEFKRRIFAGLISNNPHETAEYRWGERRGPSQRALSCESWDAWSPDLSKQ
jgi:hypothetical protein